MGLVVLSSTEDARRERLSHIAVCQSTALTKLLQVRYESDFEESCDVVITSTFNNKGYSV